MFPTNIKLPLASSQDQKNFVPAGHIAPEYSGGCGLERGETPVSPPPLVVLSGIDTIVISFQAEIPSAFTDALKESKENLQSSTDSALFVQFGETSLFSFNLQRTGKKFYPYILKTADFTVFLSSRDSKSSIPSMQISVGSMSCNNDLGGLLRSFKMWCKHHKILILIEKVGRVDFFADIALPIEKLSLWNQSKMVTRAEKVAVYYSNRRLSGVQVGSGDVVLRMYDKVREMNDKQALQKIEFFQGLWKEDFDKVQFVENKEDYQNITRVEFQLRRECIKQFCPIDSSFFAVAGKSSEIWQYLTQVWFRQTAKAVDRLNKNQAHSTVSDFWLIVQQAVLWFSKIATRIKKLRTINIKSLIDQAAGIMLTVCAGLGHHHKDFFGILSTSAALVQDRVVESMNATFFKSDFERRVATAKVSF